MYKTLRHTKQEKVSHFAGKPIHNPQHLSIGTSVTIFVKGIDSWWDHGLISLDGNGRKIVKCCFRSYDFDEVEVYSNTRFSRTSLCY